MLKIENLCVSYGGIKALRGISLEVPDGKIVTLIGANGAGKSTTLRTISGLVKADSGSITYDGQELLGKPINKILEAGIAQSPEGRRVFANLTVLENLKAGVSAEKAGEVNNPYQQWIGADIRSDPWGWACAGNPEKAAEYAWRDAYLSHRRNGIYGEMFFAAAQAAAFSVDSPEEAIRIGLTEIPTECTLAKDVEWALEKAPEVKNWEDARKLVDERFAGMNAVHTNNNACLTIFGLILGNKDYTKTIGEVIAMGLDNDCTGATAGSVLGGVIGLKNIPAHWTKNFNNKVFTYIKGSEELALDDVINRFLALAKRGE